MNYKHSDVTNDKYNKLVKELEQSRAENIELKKIKSQFELLVNNIDDFIWLVDENLNFTYVSPSVNSILGLNEKHFKDGSFLENAPSESAAIIKEAFADRKKNISPNTRKEWKLIFYHANGSKVWLETITNPIINESGIFKGVIGVSRDITLKQNAKQKYKEEQANLIAQIENTSDSIWSIDKEYRILTLNSNFKKYFELSFGVPLNEGTNIVELLPEPYRELWAQRYNKALKGKSFKETDKFDFDNVPNYVEISFNPILLDNVVIGVSCFSRDITAYKLSEKALIESESRFKTLVANLPSVAFRCKIDDFWTMLFISKEIESLSGYPPSDFINNKAIAFVDIIYIEDRERNSKIILDAIRKQISYSIEYRLVNKDKSIKWVHERGRGNYNEHNEILWLDGVISDVTSRKLAEQAMIESEQRLRGIFDTTSSAIAIQDNEKIYLVNKAWEKITGYSNNDSKTIIPKTIIHPQERDAIDNISKKRLKGENAPSNYHSHIITKQGEEKWVDISATVIDYEGNKANLIVASDITERKLADLELKKLSAGIMNSPSSIVITDIDGNIEYVNPYFCESTGYSFDEAVGNNPKILNSGTNPIELYKDMWNTILSGEVWNGTLENKKKNGELYWESARIAPILDDNGIIVSFIAIKEDITEQKRYQEMIEQSEQDLRALNAKKDKFFSIIAHDLRSPFVGLVGLTDLLKDNYSELSDEKIQYYLKYANEAAHSVFKLLENLLEWAKSQTGRIEFKPEQIDLTELIQDAFGIVNISAKNKEINLINFAYSDVKLSADKNMVFTILRNLISNAIKYTPRNGKIEIDAKAKGRFVIVSIKDTGMGIPKDKQKSLFNIEESFSTQGTEKEKGSGLGLIICKEFVEKHGGEIWCKSEEGKGSTFSFSLPVFKRSTD